MSEAPEDLMDLYIDELKDLWSANDQMQRALQQIIPEASDPQLKEMLERSLDGIGRHTETLKELIEDNDETVEKEHCRGMQGLVAEAIKHTIDDAPEKGPVLDAQIIAQYQRMTHYGIAGFGTAAAYAEALDLDDDVEVLKKATHEIYSGDEFMTKLAETSVNIEAVEG